MQNHSLQDQSTYVESILGCQTFQAFDQVMTKIDEEVMTAIKKRNPKFDQGDITEEVEKKISSFIEDANVSKEKIQTLIEITYLASEIYNQGSIDELERLLLKQRTELKQNKKENLQDKIKENEEEIKKLQRESDKFSRMRSIIETIKSMAIKKMIDRDHPKKTNKLKEIDKLEENVNKPEDVKRWTAIEKPITNKYAHFFGLASLRYQSNDFLKDTNLNNLINNTDKYVLETKIYTFPFSYMKDNLRSFLKKQSFLGYDKKEMALLTSNINEIPKDATEDEKLNKLEEAIFKTYEELRRKQGKFGSRLANTLEKFMTSPYGLNLPLKNNALSPLKNNKYDLNITFRKPLNAEDSKELLLFLNTSSKINNKAQSSYEKSFKYLVDKLEFEHTKKNHDIVSNLIYNLNEIRKNEETDKGKREEMKTLIIECLVDKVNEKPKRLFGNLFNSSNLTNILETFLKKEFGRDAIKELKDKKSSPNPIFRK